MTRDTRKPVRQGDVLCVPIAAAPKQRKPVARDSGRIVLAYGEVTGHAHAITDAWAELFEAADQGRVLLVEEKPARLTHEEHGTIVLDPGVRQIVRQSEYTPEAIRQVAD